jgi:hypothetical protein
MTTASTAQRNASKQAVVVAAVAKGVAQARMDRPKMQPQQPPQPQQQQQQQPQRGQRGQQKATGAPAVPCVDVELSGRSTAARRRRMGSQQRVVSVVPPLPPAPTDAARRTSSSPAQPTPCVALDLFSAAGPAADELLLDTSADAPLPSAIDCGEAQQQEQQEQQQEQQQGQQQEQQQEQQEEEEEEAPVCGTPSAAGASQVGMQCGADASPLSPRALCRTLSRDGIGGFTAGAGSGTIATAAAAAAPVPVPVPAPAPAPAPASAISSSGASGFAAYSAAAIVGGVVLPSSPSAMELTATLPYLSHGGLGLSAALEAAVARSDTARAASAARSRPADPVAATLLRISGSHAADDGSWSEEEEQAHFTTCPPPPSLLGFAVASQLVGAAVLRPAAQPAPPAAAGAAIVAPGARAKAAAAAAPPSPVLRAALPGESPSPSTAELAMVFGGGADGGGCRVLPIDDDRREGTGGCPSMPRLLNPVAARLLGAFERSFGDDSLCEEGDGEFGEGSFSGAGDDFGAEDDEEDGDGFSPIVPGRRLAEHTVAPTAVVVPSRRAVLL